METNGEKFFVGKSLRVFISYANEDKKIAGSLKDALEDFGLNVFLAHEDIDGGKEWEEEILRTLKQADIFIPILTDNFTQSAWTDQETGIAVCEKKIIIPVKIGETNPYGFVKKYQAQKLKERSFIQPELLPLHQKFNYKEATEGIINFVFERKEYRENLKDCTIKAFIGSNSYREANRRAKLLMKFENFTKEQTEAIMRGAIENRQVYEAGPEGKEFLTRMANEKSESVDKELKEDFRAVINAEDEGNQRQKVTEILLKNIQKKKQA